MTSVSFSAIVHRPLSRCHRVQQIKSQADRQSVVFHCAGLNIPIRRQMCRVINHELHRHTKSFVGGEVW